jgi:hypothetical protein
MGYRTLSVNLVLRALFLDGDAYDQLRDDDNPFIEGLFLVVIVAAGTAVLNLIGQFLAWASMPQMGAIKQVVGEALQRMPWWGAMAANPQALQMFQRIWDLNWQLFPRLFGAPDPGSAALNILIWPLTAVMGWLIYGVLAHLFAKLLSGTGTLNATLGTTALAISPFLFRGLGFIPFFAVGSAIGTWQLICRYKAVRSAHRLSWGRAFWVTLLPFAVYLLFWLLLGGIGAGIVALLVRR